MTTPDFSFATAVRIQTPADTLQGGQQQACSCSSGKRHAGCEIAIALLTVFRVLPTVHLLLPTPVYYDKFSITRGNVGKHPCN